MLVRRDPAVMVGIGAIEVRQRRSLSFGERDPAIVVGVGHVEHFAAKAHAAHVHHVHLHARHVGHRPWSYRTLAVTYHDTRCSRTSERPAMNSWRLILPSRLLSSLSKIALRSPILTPCSASRLSMSGPIAIIF